MLRGGCRGVKRATGKATHPRTARDAGRRRWRRTGALQPGLQRNSQTAVAVHHPGLLGLVPPHSTRLVVSRRIRDVRAAEQAVAAPRAYEQARRARPGFGPTLGSEGRVAVVPEPCALGPSFNQQII